MPKCVVCKKECEEAKFELCFDCYKSLNSWILNKCKELKYTKIRTGLVLMVNLSIGDWIKEQQDAY